MPGTWRGLFAIAVHDAAARQVVGRELDADPVARRDAYEVAAHTAGGVGDELMTALDLHLEHRVRQCLRDHGVHDDRRLFLAAVIAVRLADLLRTSRTS